MGNKPGHDELQTRTRNLSREKKRPCVKGMLRTYRYTVCTSVSRLSHLSWTPALFASQGTCQSCSLAQGEQGRGDEPAGTGPAPSLSHTQTQSLFKAGPSRDTTLQSRTGMVQVMEPHGSAVRYLPAVVTVDTWGITEPL